jgi:carbon-monoxide dehydrogenase large subunit
MPPGESFGLDTTEFWDQPFSSVSAAVHVAEVSIEKVSGRVQVERYAIVHDCGRVVNPMIVDGQVHGAVLQGLGPALLERLVLDDAGQPLTTTLLDYTLPTTLDMPDIAMEHIETPALDTRGGVRGMAEGGTIGAIPVLVGAVNDALRTGAGHRGWLRSIPVRAEDLLRIIRSTPGTQEG